MVDSRPHRWPMPILPAPKLDELRSHQDGVLTTGQALAAGVTESVIRAHLAGSRWQRLHRGVYATFSGPVPRRCQLWAAVLAAGPDAVLSHQSAAEVLGLVDHPTRPIHVSVPPQRKVARIPGVIAHRSARLVGARHPVASPPRTRVDETVIDLTQTARSLRDAYGWLARAVNMRLTTSERLVATMAQRPKLRWRRALREGLGDVAEGCRSVLEIAYLRDVERAHGLPTGDRQSPLPQRLGRIYIDVRYREFGVRIELDGRAAHPYDQQFRDMARDNLATAVGDSSLRYGTPDVYERPCAVAAQVVTVLWQRGWPGAARRCPRGDCTMS